MFDYKLAINGFPIDEECIVIRRDGGAPQRFDYSANEWVEDYETWWDHFLGDNGHEDITVQEAKGIIRRFGGSAG